MTSQIPLWIIPFFPLIGALLLGAIALAQTRNELSIPEAYIGALAVSFPLLSFVATLMFALDMPHDGVYAETLGDWISIADFQIPFGFLFDSLTKIMLLFITGITTLIVLYSTGYMKGDSGYIRFMCYMNLFLFSMLILVLSDSLPLTFLGWEGVGLCSYLLVGFWNKDLLNCKAANKAFLVNRVGDAGFLLGMFALAALGGAEFLNYASLNEGITGGMTHSYFNPAFVGFAALLFFFACTAKSAQVPLLTWLPDAMAGPTPVSALIHAATMVTAGVYLMSRLGFLFNLVPGVLVLVLLVALATALWAAIAGLVQHDIKKVLAYSTVSQLGFMFMAAGVGAYDVAIFHVFTHAFTKAALFLGAGSVIHALGGEQDIRKMGGLAFKLPSTFLIMLVAWASLIGLPGLSCFWSKDLIMERVYGSFFMGPVFYGVALFTALLTAVYMTRLMVLAFLGIFRGDNHALEHTHDSPIVMQIPMWILTAGCVFAGYAWAGLIPGLNYFEKTLEPVLGYLDFISIMFIEQAAHASVWFFAFMGSGAALVGLMVAFFYFSKKIPKHPGHGELVGFAKIWTFSFDTLHYVCGILPVRIAISILDLLNKFLRTTMSILSIVPYICSEGLRFMQTGKLRIQLALSLISSVALVYWLVFFIR
jgi:NADH-quinone oxidoreductase subunit L